MEQITRGLETKEEPVGASPGKRGGYELSHCSQDRESRKGSSVIKDSQRQKC